MLGEWEGMEWGGMEDTNILVVLDAVLISFLTHRLGEFEVGVCLLVAVDRGYF